MSVRLQDVMFYAGGECYQKFGTLIWRMSRNQDTRGIFTRSGAVGPFVDKAGVIRQASANRLRTEWVGGVPYLLLEDARTNLTDEDDLTNWTAVNSPTVTGSVSDPAGGTSAFSVEDNSSALERVFRVIAYTGDAVKAGVVVVKEGTMPASNVQALRVRDQTAGVTRLQFDISAWVDGEPTVVASTGTLLGTRLIGDGWWAIYGQSTSVTAANTNAWEIYPALAAAESGIINVFRCNTYDATVPLSSILNEAEVFGAETFYGDFPHPPQEMTVYAKFVERGTLLDVNTRLFHIGAANAATDPRFTVFAGNGNNYRGEYDDGTTVTNDDASLSVISTGAVGELRVVINADGSFLMGQSVNGGAESITATTAAVALPAAWADTRLYINSAGTSVQGTNAFAAIKVARGVQTLADMRALFARVA